MEIILCSVTTAGHRALPRGSEWVPGFVRISSWPNLCCLHSPGNVIRTEHPQAVVSPPLVSLQSAPEMGAIEAAVAELARPLTGTAKVTAFLVNERVHGEFFRAGVALVDGDRVDNLLLQAGLHKGDVRGFIVS